MNPQKADKLVDGKEQSEKPATEDHNDNFHYDDTWDLLYDNIEEDNIRAKRRRSRKKTLKITDKDI